MREEHFGENTFLRGEHIFSGEETSFRGGENTSTHCGWSHSFAFPGEPGITNPSSEEGTAEETSDEDTSGDYSSDYSDERTTSEQSSLDSEILLCRFKTRQTLCKQSSLEDQYYCHKHLQFDDNLLFLVTVHQSLVHQALTFFKDTVNLY